MNDIFTAPFLTEMRQTAANMYRLGWDERNGGNISLLLDEAEAQKYLDRLTFPTLFCIVCMGGYLPALRLKSLRAVFAFTEVRK